MIYFWMVLQNCDERRCLESAMTWQIARAQYNKLLKAYGQLKEEGLEILCGLEISKLAGALAYEHMAQPTLLGG